MSTIEERLDAIEGMLKVIAGAPSVSRHVQEMTRLQAGREHTERLRRFSAAADPAGKVEVLAGMLEGHRRRVLADISEQGRAAFFAALDEEQRRRAATWFDPAQRREIACAVNTQIEIVGVRCADPNSAISLSFEAQRIEKPSVHWKVPPPFRLDRGEVKLMARRELDALCAEHPQIGSRVESGEILVETLTDRRAAGYRGIMIDRGELVQDGNLTLWPSRRVVSADGLSDRVVRDDEPQPDEEQPDEEQPHLERAGMARAVSDRLAFNRKMKEQADQRQAERVAAAVVEALGGTIPTTTTKGV